MLDAGTFAGAPQGSKTKLTLNNVIFKHLLCLNLFIALQCAMAIV